MLTRTKIDKLDDYFINLNSRKIKGVYFCRINGYNKDIHDFILKYYEAARVNGVIIEGKIPNPDNNNLAFYNEIMGSRFQFSYGFISDSLKKWLPRMTASQRDNVSGAIYDTLYSLQQQGKNENILKNVYIKFMCWLYYKFERIVNHLGEDNIPKILYEGNISNHELLLMNVLLIAGCDILLLQYKGDAEYLKLDSASASSEEYRISGMTAFPADFSIKQLVKEIQERMNNQRLYGELPGLRNSTNGWMKGKTLENLLLDPYSRGREQGVFYNCFCRIKGAEDRVTYTNELYVLQSEIKARKRHIVIVNNLIEPPSPDEIKNINRNNYQNLNQLIVHLSKNIQQKENSELQRLMVKSFVDLLLEEGKKNTNLNRITNKAVYLLCWLNRYRQQLFSKWNGSEIACFFYLGGCRNENEAMFLRFLSKLPVDVIIFTPNQNQVCCLQDEGMHEEIYSESLMLDRFPEDQLGMRVGTVAYHAERDLDTLIYQDTGIFRDQQYSSANTIALQTMYEEISILWNQELKYRPNFGTSGGAVSIPVIFSKISGVKDGNLQAYWSSIKKLMTEDTRLVKSVPDIKSTDFNPVKSHAVEFFKNGRLQKSKIKASKDYQYGFLRESMQDHLLEKLQFLIDQKFIKGTFENGTEYTIISVALNLDKDILRRIQKFDFTKKNPKLLYIITKETQLSLEDSIYAVFLNLVGFDILFYVPTGYQCIEKHFNRRIIEEHTIGEYIYDLEVPDFSTIHTNVNSKTSFFGFFKKGV